MSNIRKLRETSLDRLLDRFEAEIKNPPVSVYETFRSLAEGTLKEGGLGVIEARGIAQRVLDASKAHVVQLALAGVSRDEVGKAFAPFFVARLREEVGLPAAPGGWKQS